MREYKCEVRKVGNLISIKGGTGVPASGSLSLRELGIDLTNNILYIGKGDGSSVALNTAESVGAIKRAGDTVVNGHFVYYNTSPVASISLFYTGSPFELREAGGVGNTQSADVYSPSVGFRWKDVAGAAIVMPSDGKFYRISNSGNKYRIYDAQDVIPVTGGGTGSTTVAGARNNLGLGNTSGALPIANGGTGQTTVAAARNALGLGNTSGAVPIANGGTGATTVAGARNALGLGDTAGAIPIANGGTGQTTVAAARNAFGLGNTAGAVPIANGGTESTNARDAANSLYFFNLRERVDIPASSDFNNYTTSGNWRITSSANAATMANIPCNRAGTLTVMHSLGGTSAVHMTQIYMAFDISEASLDAGVWIRQSVDSVWRQWHQVLAQSNSGWTNATLSSGITSPGSYGDGRLRYRKEGSHVYVAGGFNTAWTASKQICSIPYGPATSNMYFLQACGGANIARIYIRPDGTIHLEWVRALSNGSENTSFDSWVDCNLDFWIA